MKTVAVLGTHHPDAMALLDAREDVRTVVVENAEPEAQAIAAAIAGCHGIAVRSAKLTADLLALAPDLQAVSRHGVGCDSIDVAWLTARKLPMMIATGANTVSVVEHVFMMMLALARQLSRQDGAMQAGEWSRRGEAKTLELRGKTLLIVGCGRIGSQIVPVARAFGMEALAADPYITAFPDGVESVTLAEGLTRADIVTVHTPLNPETRGLIGTPELAALRPGALVVNCARGGIVSEEAAAEALRSGHLAGFGVDVFDPEPLDPKNPLLGAPNTVMTAHTAAFTPEAMRRMATMCIQNILDVFDGRTNPENVFNRTELGL